MAKTIKGYIELVITVDPEAWELAYGKAEDVADLKADIQGHVQDTIEEAVKTQFAAQANGSELVRIGWR